MGLIHCMQYLRLAFCLSECPIGQRTESYLLPNMDLAEDFFFLINIAVVLFFAIAAKSLQSCSTLCDPTDGSPPGSPVPGILQARTLEWVAIAFSNS